MFSAAYAFTNEADAPQSELPMDGTVDGWSMTSLNFELFNRFQKFSVEIRVTDTGATFGRTIDGGAFQEFTNGMKWRQCLGKEVIK